MQEICSEVVATLKMQYDGLNGGSDGVVRQQLAFIQQWSSSPFLESMGIHIRWNYRVPNILICKILELMEGVFFSRKKNFMNEENDNIPYGQASFREHLTNIDYLVLL